MESSVTLLQSVVLGIIQGVTEFLPISSSAHLALLPWFFNWPDQGLTFDIALHFGTLLAIVLFFWRDYLKLKPRLWGFLAVGTVPGAVLGFIGEDWLEAHLRNPVSIAALLIVFAIFMGLADRFSKKTDSIDDLTLLPAFLIGCGQALALMPGVSRSGVTMTAALLCGLSRESAARYAFLLGGPILLGAAVHNGLSFFMKAPSPSEMKIFLIGLAVCTVVGMASIAFLMKYLKTQSLDLFVGYRIALGVLIIALAITRS